MFLDFETEWLPGSLYDLESARVELRNCRVMINYGLLLFVHSPFRSQAEARVRHANAG